MAELRRVFSERDVREHDRVGEQAYPEEEAEQIIDQAWKDELVCLEKWSMSKQPLRKPPLSTRMISLELNFSFNWRLFR